MRVNTGGFSGKANFEGVCRQVDGWTENPKHQTCYKYLSLEVRNHHFFLHFRTVVIDIVYIHRAVLSCCFVCKCYDLSMVFFRTFRI